MNLNKILIIALTLLSITVIGLTFIFMRLKNPLTNQFSDREKIIRPSVAAGSYYPRDKETLRQQINNFLDQTIIPPLENIPQIIILPHAGYTFSGQTAAYGIKAIAKADFDRIILIGPSHQDTFKGIALYQGDAWQTPLGEVEVDQKFNQKLIKENENIFFRNQAHQREHCLEVELPFLQSVFKEFKIVPIILGPLSDYASLLAQILAEQMDDKTLVIISSDLSHYPPYEIANRVDHQTINAILSGEVENFKQSIEQSTQKYPDLKTCACGEQAISTGMILAKKLGLAEIELLHYTNSGDVSGDYSQVVGYATISFSKKGKSAPEEELTEQEKEKLLQVARQSIIAHLQRKSAPKFTIESDRLKQPRGAFVTLRDTQGELRGCIGRIEEYELPLYQVVAKMAIAAATQDDRFPPVSLEEMEQVNIEISVLSAPQKIKNPEQEIELGKHGVIVQKGIHSGVLLPQVATENDWDLETFLGTLCIHKAGLAWDAWKDKNTEIYIFSAEVFSEDKT